jgi:putative SOS response-associated peptidase YedK
VCPRDDDEQSSEHQQKRPVDLGVNPLALHASRSSPYESTSSGKQPYAIALADRGLMALAGLWETWRSQAGERVRSFAIITTTPNELCAQLHNRMPVVLKPAAWPAWLGEEPADAPQLKALLAPYPSEEMVAWPVSPRVGNVKNNGPSLIEPVAGAG